MLRNLKSILSIERRLLQTRTFSSIARLPPPPPPPPLTGGSISNELPHLLQSRSRSRIMSHFIRRYSVDTSDEVNEINMKFAEARDDIESALESKETVYFNEEAECARDSVKEVLDMFQGLLEKLPEGERGALRRSMGLKMEQLKAELDQLND